MATPAPRRTRQCHPQGRHRQGADRRHGARRAGACAGRRLRRARRAAEAAAKLAGVEKVLLADAPAYAHALAEPLAALIVGLARAYDAIVAPSTSAGKNVMPRVAALLDVMQVSDVIKVICARHLRAADLCRQRHPDRAVDRRQEGHHRAHRLLPGAPARAARRRRGRQAAADPASPPSRARRWRSPTGPS